MPGQKITERAKMTVNSDASVLITQQTTEDGETKERVKRATLQSVLDALETLGITASNIVAGTITEQMLSSSLKQAVIDGSGAQLYYDEEEQKLYLLNAEGQECGEGIEIDASGGGLAFDAISFENGQLHITLNGEDVVEPCEITGGGGGGVDVGSTIRIVNKTAKGRNFSVLDTDANCNIRFKATSVDTSDSTPTGNLTAYWYVNNTRKAVQTVVQDNSEYTQFDIKPYISMGENVVKLTIEDSYSNTKSFSWNITVTAYTLSWNLDNLSYHGTSGIQISLVANGSGSKTVKVKIHHEDSDTDELLYSQASTATGRTIYVDVDPQDYGAHTIEAWMEINIAGETVSTEPLRHTGLWSDAESEGAIIAVQNRNITATQYNTINIPYMIYDPENEQVTATLLVDNVLVSTVTVSREMQNWSYRPETSGSHTLTIVCGNTECEISLTVTAIAYNISPVTQGLVMDINPTGHSNSEAGYNIFGYKDENGTNHPFTFSANFDWRNGGFKQDDDGVTALVIKRGTYITCDRSLFSDNAMTNGKEIKIVFKATQVRNYNAEILDCSSGGIGLTLQAQQGSLTSQLKGLTVQYCEDRKIEMDINIESSAENKLAMIWLEGVPSSIFAYSDGDSFTQSPAKNVKIGSDECDIWLYRLKMYNHSLTRYDIKDNFIADCSDATEMVARYQRNNIYDGSGNLNIDAISQNNPELRVIHISAGKMTTAKDDEVSCTVEIKYRNGSAGQNIVAENVTMKAQGTSSLKYGLAALNLDLDFKNASSWKDSDDEDVTGYSLRTSSIPVNYLNVKLNVASSENANNVILADEYNMFQPYLTPARQEDDSVRDTIEGVPCAVFFTNTSNTTQSIGARDVAPGETVLYGCGDLNNSKKNFAVFGQTSDYPLQCCIEITNNNNPQCLFKSDDLTTETWDGDENTSNFEFRYPKNPTNEMKALLQTLLTWVKSTDRTAVTEPYDALTDVVTYGGVPYTHDTPEYRAAKFKAEVSDYFAVDSLLYHYLFTERHLMVDNRAKNTFISYEYDEDEEKYLWNFTKDYDNDTADGNDNSGGLTFTYGMEDTDISGASYVFNAHSSVLWCNVRDCLAAELATMYADRKSVTFGANTYSAWDADRIIAKFEQYQSARPEALVAEDMFGKYVCAYTLGDGASYLTMLLGNKTDQRAQFEKYQELYIESKYKNMSVNVSNSIEFRINAPEEWSGVEPSGDIVDVVPYSDCYIKVKFGNAGQYTVRARRGQEYTLPCPQNAVLNDLETYVFPASNIAHIGSMAALYTKLADISGARRLQELLLGSGENGYENTAGELSGGATISVANNKLLEVIDLRGMTYLNIPLDLKNLISLREIYANNSGITGVEFADGAPIEKIYLPAVRRLVAKNLGNLSEFYGSGENLQSIIVENCPDIDTYALIANASGLTRGRLTDVDWNIETADAIMALINKAGYGPNGEDTSHFVLTGSCTVSMMSQDEIDAIEAAFPDLDLTCTTTLSTYTVTFVDEDGTTVLDTQEVRQYGAAVNPVTAGRISTPTKASTIENTYAFTGWDTAFNYVLQDLTVTAQYAATARTYTVRWWSNSAHTSLLYTQSNVSPYGVATFGGTEPTSAVGSLWVGWSEDTGRVTADMDVYAVFISPTMPDTVASGYDYLYSDDENDNSGYTLAEFYGIISAGRAKDYFSVGDKVKMIPGAARFSDETIIFQLEAFNHFKLADNSGNFASCTFGMIGLLGGIKNATTGLAGGSTRRMNASNTNYTTSYSQLGGWPATEMRNWLNETLYPLLPQKWKAMIKQVVVRSSAGNNSTSIVSSNDYLYLRSQSEMGFGTTAPYGDEVDADADNKAFTCYTNATNRTKKYYNGSGSADHYWLRSPASGGSSAFCFVNDNGYSYTNGATSKFGVSACFSI